MKSYLDDLSRPFFALAPMYDVTDTIFRQIVGGCAKPDLYFTEFVNADGLQSAGREKIIFRLKSSPAEKPLIAQIWGKVPQNFQNTAQDIVKTGFAGVDINMGCPDKAVLKNGCCAALIENHDLAAEIIKATKKGTNSKIPISLKTRIGFREFDPDWFKFLFSQNLEMLIVHLRTVREMSKVPAHWELMSEIRQMRDELSPKTLLVGNGGVSSRHEASKLAKKHKIDGVMIGTGIFNDPYIFANDSPWNDMSTTEKIRLFQKHVELFDSTWKNQERPIITLNKFCKIYVSGFNGAKEARESLMHARSTDELLDQIDNLMHKLA